MVLASLLLVSLVGVMALLDFFRGADEAPDDAEDASSRDPDTSSASPGDVLDASLFPPDEVPPPSEEGDAPADATQQNGEGSPAPGAVAGDVPQDEAEPPVPSEEPGSPEQVRLEVTPGLHDLSFVEASQPVVLNVPENTTGYLEWPGDPSADPPEPAALTCEVPGGAVEILFPPDADLESTAYTVSVAGTDPIALSSLLLNDIPGLMPDDPNLPAAPDLPGRDLPEGGEGDAPLVPDEPSGGALMAGGGQGAPADPDAPVAVEGFVPGEDLLTITGDPEALLSIKPSEDAQHSEVYLDDHLAAIVLGVPDLSPDDVVISVD